MTQPSLRAVCSALNPYSGGLPVQVSSTETNDIMLVCCISGSSACTFGAPAGDGWTSINKVTGTNIVVEWFWKRASGTGDQAQKTFTATDTANSFIFMVVYKDCITTGTPYEDATTAGEGSSNPTTAVVTPTKDDELAVCLVGIEDDTAVSGYPPSGWNGRFSDGDNAGTDGRGVCIDKTSVTKGVDVAQVTVCTVSEYWASLTLLLIPANMAFAPNDAGSTTGSEQATMAQNHALASSADVGVTTQSEQATINRDIGVTPNDCGVTTGSEQATISASSDVAVSANDCGVTTGSEQGTINRDISVAPNDCGVTTGVEQAPMAQDHVLAGADTGVTTGSEQATINRDIGIIANDAGLVGSTQVEWGCETEGSGNSAFDRPELMGNTSPNLDNMVLEYFEVYLSNHSQQGRCAVYTGGALNNPNGATLLEDLGQTSGSNTGWVRVNSTTRPTIPKNTPLWVVFKGNASSGRYRYSTTSSGCGEYQTARGRCIITEGMNRDETVAYESTIPNAGVFNDYWMAWRIGYSVTGGGIYAEQATINRDIGVAPNDAGVTTGSEQASMAQDHVVAGTDAGVTTGAEQAPMAQDHVLAGSDAGVTTGSEQATITTGGVDHPVSANDCGATTGSEQATINRDVGVAPNDAGVATGSEQAPMAQDHALSGNDCGATTGSEQASCKQDHRLTGNDAGASSGSEQGSITQNHSLAGNDAGASSGAEQATVVRNVEVSANDAGVTTGSEQATISVEAGNVGIMANDCGVTTGSEQGAITQVHNLSGNDTGATGGAEQASIAQNHVIAGSDVGVTTGSENASIVEVGNNAITANDCGVTTGAESPKLVTVTEKVYRHSKIVDTIYLYSHIGDAVKLNSKIEDEVHRKSPIMQWRP